jgi:hypothetical protein
LQPKPFEEFQLPGGLLLNAQEVIPIITALEEMGHKQPSTGAPLKTHAIQPSMMFSKHKSK